MEIFDELGIDFDDRILTDEYDDDTPLFSPSARYSNDEYYIDDDPADMLKIDPRIREYNSAFYPKLGKRLF